MRITDLLENQDEETEFTDNKLPEEILHELTKDFEKPKLPRISKKELYNLLQSNTDSLMPFANLLQHWTVDDDEKLQSQLKEMNKDVNIVDINKVKDEEKTSEQIAAINDTELMDIMEKQYLDEYKNNENKINELYKTALLYYDISDPLQTESSATYMNNRVASIFFILASHLGHIEAQC